MISHEREVAAVRTDVLMDRLARLEDVAGADDGLVSGM